jgi:hypothetical protein
MQASSIVSEATAVCLQSFTDCLAVMKNEWAENRLAEFNLSWVSGIGASARTTASLDSRLAFKPEALAFRPEACGAIANILRLLAGAVAECKRLGQASD